eukprot:1077622-Pleurochrysis_carterae.AAC.1
MSCVGSTIHGEQGSFIKRRAGLDHSRHANLGHSRRARLGHRSERTSSTHGKRGSTTSVGRGSLTHGSEANGKRGLSTHGARGSISLEEQGPSTHGERNSTAKDKQGSSSYDERNSTVAYGLLDAAHTRTRHVCTLYAHTPVLPLHGACPLRHYHTRHPYAHMSRACAPLVSHPCGVLHVALRCLIYAAATIVSPCRARALWHIPLVRLQTLLASCLPARARTAAHVRPAPLHGARLL